LVPLFVLVLGGLLVWRLLGKWTGNPPADDGTNISPEDHSRVEAEMRQIRPAE
jgi:hypothetical protein